jgi:hypothetical protein
VTGERAGRVRRALLGTRTNVLARFADWITGRSYRGTAGRTSSVSWEEWFRAFDERGLNFIYQEQQSDRSDSHFFRLENPDREDA